MDCTIAIEDAAAEDVQAVRDGLVDFNLGFAPDMRHRQLCVMLRSEDGSLVGGLLGETWWEWLHINILWIHESARRQRYGEQMLRLAEKEAEHRGCHHAFLSTMSWQALPFYEKQGYEVYATLNDFPTGHKHHFVKKGLVV